MVKINKIKCEGCGVCVESCPFGVLAIKDKKAVMVKPEMCHDCQVCIQICPNKAIAHVLIDKKKKLIDEIEKK